MLVAWNHFVLGNGGGQLEGDWIRGIVHAPTLFFGKCVLLLFLIAGWVNPALLDRAAARGRAGCLPALRRVFFRLYLPFAAAVLLGAVLDWASTLSPWYAGEPLTWKRLALVENLTLSPEFVGRAWMSPVYWSLGIQLQFLVVLISLRRFLSGARPWLGPICTALCFAGPVCVPVVWFPHFLPFFWLGILYYDLTTQERVRGVCFAQILAVLVAIGLSWGWVSVALSALPLLLVRRCPPAPRWLRWLGDISFSLFLTHTFVGGRVMNLLGRWLTSDGGRCVMLVLALVASVTAAWLFHRVIEGPLHRIGRASLRGGISQPVTGGLSLKEAA